MRCARYATATSRTTSVVITERVSPVRTGGVSKRGGVLQARPSRLRVSRCRTRAIPISDSSDDHRDGAAVATTYSASKTAERYACNPPGCGLQATGLCIRCIVVRHAAARIAVGSRRYRPHGAGASLLTPGVTHTCPATHDRRAQRAGVVANSPRCSLVTSLPCPSLRLRSAPLAARSLSTSVRWNSAAYIAAV